MTSKFWTKQKKQLACVLGVVAFGILLCFALLHLDSIRGGVRLVFRIMTPFLYGGVVAYLLDPVCDWLYARFLRLLSRTRLSKKRAKGISNALSILISLLFLLGLVALLLALVIPQLGASIAVLADAVPDYASDIYHKVLPLVKDTELEGWLLEFDLVGKIQDWATNTLLPNADSILASVATQVTSVFNFFYNLIIGFIVSFYCLNYRAKFALQGKKAIFALLPFRWAEELLERLRFADKAFSGFISGKILDSLIIGVITFFVCLILRMPYYPLIAVIVGVTNVIPFFGPFIGAVPSAFLILMEHPLKAVYFVIFIIILQQFDGNILSPRILSSSVGVSGFWVLFSILLFGGLFGVVGMLIGTPLFAVIYSIVRDWIDARLRRKLLPREAWQYDDLDAFETAHRPAPEPASDAVPSDTEV